MSHKLVTPWLKLLHISSNGNKKIFSWLSIKCYDAWIMYNNQPRAIVTFDEISHIIGFLVKIGQNSFRTCWNLNRSPVLRLCIQAVLMTQSCMGKYHNLSYWNYQGFQCHSFWNNENFYFLFNTKPFKPITSLSVFKRGEL